MATREERVVERLGDSLKTLDDLLDTLIDRFHRDVVAIRFAVEDLQKELKGGEDGD